MANEKILDASKKYLDLSGLQSFWTKAKSYIDTQDGAVISKLQGELSKAVGDLKGTDFATADYKDIATLSAKVKAAEGAVAQEVTDRQGEITRVEGLVTAEKEAREGAISGLQGKDFTGATYKDIAALSGAVEAAAGAAEAAAGAAAAADAAVKQEVADRQGEITRVEGLVTAEQGARAAAIKGLQGDETAFAAAAYKDIVALSGAIKANEGAISKEIEDRQGAISGLQGTGYADAAYKTVASLSGAVVEAKGVADGAAAAVAQEAKDRAAADKGLQDAIDALDKELEDVKAAAGVTSVGVDANGTYVKASFDQTKGDVKLSIDESALATKFEGVEKAISDNDAAQTKALEDAIKAEQEARGEAVEGLQGQISTLSGAAVKSVTKGQGKETYVALAIDAKDDNGAVKVSINDSQLVEKIQGFETKINALSGATEFVGVVEWDPTQVTVGDGVDGQSGLKEYPISGTGVQAGLKLNSGDIVISGAKEYILDGSQKKFVELGDTTAEQTQITALEGWVNDNAITTSDINNLGWTPAYTA